jgi:hypothetical protein
MFLALAIALLHPAVAAVITLSALIGFKFVKWILLWLLSLPFLFGTTVAYPGFGSHLASGGTAGSSYTNVAQLKNIKFSGIKAAFDKITNLDSPTGGGGNAVFEEYIKTMVDGDSVTFDFVFNNSDPSMQGLLTNLQLGGQSALYFWKITLTSGSTLVFQGYASDFKIDVAYDKAIVGNGSIKLVGPITATW